MIDNNMPKCDWRTLINKIRGVMSIAQAQVIDIIIVATDISADDVMN